MALVSSSSGLAAASPVRSYSVRGPGRSLTYALPFGISGLQASPAVDLAAHRLHRLGPVHAGQVGVDGVIYLKVLDAQRASYGIDNFLFAGSIVFLALVGSKGQEIKKKKLGVTRELNELVEGETGNEILLFFFRYRKTKNLR